MSEVSPPIDVYLFAGLIALALAGLFAYPIYRMLLALKSRQTVSEFAPEGHQRKQGTPTMGGLIIVVGAAAGFIFEIVAMPSKIPIYDASPIFACLVLLVGFALVGFTDDFVVPRLLKGKRGLGWKQKILMQAVFAGAAVWLDHRSFDLAWGAGVFLVLFFSNAYNFSDGLDWLAGTLVLALGAGLIAVAWYAKAFGVAGVVIPTLAATIPFLILNKPPAKLFMGDAGSLPVGALLGYSVAGISLPMVTPHLYTWGYGDNGFGMVFSGPSSKIASAGFLLALCVLSFVMIAELVPVPLQIASVKLRKKRLFPYTPIHHAFEKAGWPEGRVVSRFFACQVLLALLAWGIANWAETTRQEGTRDEAVEHVRGMR